MKVKVLSRNPDDHLRETSRDIHKIFRNYDPALHPFEAPREYARAMNATKLERIFAKPFLAALDGHKDGVCCMCKHRRKLNTMFSGSCDGEVRQWTLSTRRCIRTLQAHFGYVRSMTCSTDGNTLITVGDDKTIKHWTTSALSDDSNTPKNTIVVEELYTGIDHSWQEDVYATCGQTVSVWNYERSEPIKSYKWASDSVYSVRFNPVQSNLCISTIADRSISLYDIRAPLPVNKVVLQMRTNVAVWNPMEAFTFTAANEDWNSYTFDLRNLSCAANVHVGHVGAVLDIDYAPTGKEFVSGSYDRTLRIFPTDGTKSREIYYTKRMQKIFTVIFSADNRYVLSGSDETNIRLWKARASEKLGRLAPREKTALMYSEKLKKKFAYHPQVLRIARHRHVPRAIYKANMERRIINDKLLRRKRNKILNSKPGSLPRVPFRKKSIIETDNQVDEVNDDINDESDLDAGDDDK